MAITVGNAQKRIGLALSGGGFRAAAFHLGVFRQLQTQGLLWKLDLLTCVSGGSIAGAFLCRNWGNDAALDRLEQYLRSAWWMSAFAGLAIALTVWAFNLLGDALNDALNPRTGANP